MQTKSASYPSAAWIQDFSTVISGGAVVCSLVGDRMKCNGNEETDKVGDKYSFSFFIIYIFLWEIGIIRHPFACERHPVGNKKIY